MFWKKPTVYIQVFKGKAIAECIESAKKATVNSEALQHPRTLMGEFLAIEACFKQLITETVGDGLLKVSPRVLVHLREPAEGGYTNVEVRAFKEAAYGAGAREVRMPDNKHELSKLQISDLDFSEFDNGV